MKNLKRHSIILLALIFLSCNEQEVIPTIQIDDHGNYLYQGIKMMPLDICNNIKGEFGNKTGINLLVSKSATMESIGKLKNELVKNQLDKISYSEISSIKSDFNINGKWKVASMANSSIYALEKDDKYLNQIVEISQYQISQKSDFSILEVIDDTIPIAIKSIELITEEDLHNIYKFNIKELSNTHKSLSELKTNLDNHPFSSILVTEFDELIIGWDGLCFKLVKM